MLAMTLQKERGPDVKEEMENLPFYYLKPLLNDETNWRKFRIDKIILFKSFFKSFSLNSNFSLMKFSHLTQTAC